MKWVYITIGANVTKNDTIGIYSYLGIEDSHKLVDRIFQLKPPNLGRFSTGGGARFWGKKEGGGYLIWVVIFVVFCSILVKKWVNYSLKIQRKVRTHIVFPLTAPQMNLTNIDQILRKMTS